MTDSALAQYSEFFPSFEHINDGIVLFRADGAYLYSNTSAKKILGISKAKEGKSLNEVGNSYSEKLPDEEHAYIRDIIHPILQAHTSALNDPSVQRSDSSLTTEGEVLLRRFNQQTFPARVHTTTLTGQTASAYGYAITILDLSTRAHLDSLLQQSKRLEVFALHAMSIGLSVLKTTSSGILISPLLRMAEKIEEQPAECQLSASMTTLTECFDFLLPANISIKIQMKVDGTLALREGHILQLVSYMALHAARYVGPGGEIALTTQDTGPGVMLSLEAESLQFIPETRGDPATTLLREEIQIPEDTPLPESTSVPTGLIAAQKIASTYRTQIQYQQRDNFLRMRVELPRKRSSS